VIRLKKLVIIVLAFAIFVSFTRNTAMAATESNTHISAFGADVSFVSPGTVQVDFNVRGKSVMSSLGANRVDLYKDGSLVYTFNRSDPNYSSAMQTTNEIVFYGDVSYPASPGSTYYAKVYLFATNSLGTGYETVTTGSITVPNP